MPHNEKRNPQGKAAFVCRKLWRDRVSYAFLLPFAAVFIIFTVLPVIISVYYI